MGQKVRLKLKRNNNAKGVKILKKKKLRRRKRK